MDSTSSNSNDHNSESSSRPDWDPYAVWLTHIMKTPKTTTQAVKASQADSKTESSNDSSWNPYSVWQALIKN